MTYLLHSVDWLLIWNIVYFTVLVLVCLRIIYDTGSTSKTLAYLLLAIFVPFVGILIYFSFGINYKKRKIYTKKLVEDEIFLQELEERVQTYSAQTLAASNDTVQGYRELVNLLLNDGLSPLTGGNRVKLLRNGEEKFPEVLQALREARHYIHLEYYIIENDTIGNQIKDILIQKARTGVEVRFIYDDYGSRSIRRGFAAELRAAGVEAYPFHKVHFLLLANRLNYRNHRKIIIIDTQTAFVGGLNIADRYINQPQGENRSLYWRDTHLRIDGPGIYYLQYLFFCDWNFASGKLLPPHHRYFVAPPQPQAHTPVQIAASGPDSPMPTILFSMLQAIYLAQEEVLITTPYFIPGESILQALTVAALGGVKVKLLVPGITDSALVNAAAWSYYDDMLHAGVEIYLYQKGFIHAKTMVIDGAVSMVGTANMDNRSFELNFEVNAVVYDTDTSQQLREMFYQDLRHADKINLEVWRQRSHVKQFFEKLARLLSPLL
ncbi:cardiolipin synthase [Rufibacter latericius]|uniref:Cardiolipin synthase n=1 Tax=Rufibacter latericius TaxID=2487040 RepID=A0A3M9MP37_9BACT|nr:cardiolipin synthase [Rufibacter latericius]RNI26967.1 cardiolipin synthase [Rufibacter latericius]